MKFISLMGTQTMAVLNPLLALMEQGKEVEKVFILATKKTMNAAERIKEFLVPDRLGAEQLELIPVSNNFQTRGDKRPSPTVVAELIQDQAEIAFNLAGGLNFQIAACIQAIIPQKCLFLYPESSGIQSFVIESGKVAFQKPFDLPSSLSIETILDLQDIAFEKKSQSKDLDSFLTKFFRDAKQPIPKSALKNTVISNVEFDLILNAGNTLKFINMFSSSDKKEETLRRERALTSLARNRNLFGELYHKEIFVLTNNPKSKEKIDTESGGKIKSCLYSEYKGDLNTKMAQANLKNFLGLPDPFRLRQEDIITELTGNSVPGNTVLYTSLGTNIMPSLIALWSHNPSSVCFVYTPGVQEVEKFKESMLRLKNELPVNSISFYPVSIYGKEILDIEPKITDARYLVNVSPGTKGHTAFFTLWARRHKFPIFSLNNQKGTYEQIPEGESGQTTAPSPVLFLKINDIAVKDFGDGKTELLQNSAQHETLLRFLRQMDKEGQPISSFYNSQEKIALPAMGSEFFPKKKKLRLWEKGKKDVLISTWGDEWFEALVGFAMLQCGAQDVQVRVRTRWSKETEDYLFKKYGNDSHMTDIDVIARFNTDYYIISCKATKRKGSGKTAKEANAFASLFGRFAIPLVCYLKYAGEPDFLEGGERDIYLFGYKTLYDTEAMKDLVKKAKTKKSKTGPPEN